MRISPFLMGCIASATVVAVAASKHTDADPFYLVVSSHNKTLNGLSITSCHSQPIQEVPCVILGQAQKAASNYTYNSTDHSIHWFQPIGSGGPGTFWLDSIWQIQLFTSTNVAELLIVGDYASGSPYPNANLVFDNEDKMVIPPDNWDDTLPYNYATYPSKPTAYRWNICTTVTTPGTYRYQTLNWVVGDKAGENPTCQHVNVTRSYL